MKKTIFILTTRSFQSDTLFNPENCSPVEFNKGAPWYMHAFPQYFTDIIQFLDLCELQIIVENYILKQLPIQMEKICYEENDLEAAVRKHHKIYLKKKEKNIKKERFLSLLPKESDEQLIKETAEKFRQTFAEDLQKLLAAISEKKILTDMIKKEISEITDQLKTNKLKRILINKSNEKTELIIEKEIHKIPYRYSSLQEVKENVATDIAITTLVEALSEVIPSWWFTLLKNKNKYCYLNYEDAYSCYTFIQKHANWLLRKCSEEHSKNNHNQFSLANLLYKYTPSKV